MDAALTLHRQSETPVTAQAACHFAETCFARNHGAQIRCRYPELLVASSADGTLQAVVGIRSPDRRFHLEHYLDSPAEVVVSDTFNTHFKREELVEVGNLSGGCNPRVTTALMHALWQTLMDDGYRVLLVTGTKPLLHRFRHLPLQRLAKADPKRVPKSERWGRYYDQEPCVVAGPLHTYDKRFRVEPPQGLRITRLNNTGSNP